MTPLVTAINDKYFRLELSGDTLSVSRSSDASSWTPSQSIAFAGDARDFRIDFLIFAEMSTSVSATLDIVDP